MPDTFNQYIKEIRRKYEEEKSGNLASFLDKPSPAKIRDLCLFRLEKGINTNDENTLIIYFNAKDNSGLRTAIERFDEGKLRSVSNFLRGITRISNRKIVDFAAFLVNFQPRPYHIFTRQNIYQVETTNKPQITPLPHVPPAKDTETDSDITTITSEEIIPSVTEKKSQKSKHKTWLFVTLLALSLSFSAYQLKLIFFPEKQCMQWLGYQYELIDCESFIIPTHISPVEAYDPLKFNLKKIIPDSSIKVFENGRPNLWYLKENKVVEFFDRPGVHPITKKTLKEVSVIIYQTHYLKECSNCLDK